MIESEGMSVPISKLTWEQAMILLYHYNEGRKQRDRRVSWDAMVAHCREKHGFAAYDAGTKLREEGNPTLLQFDPRQPLSNHHWLPRGVFNDPRPLFEAINAAEKAAGRPLTPMPDIHETVGVALAIPAEQAESRGRIQIGDIIAQPDGTVVRVIEGKDGAPALERVRMVADEPRQAPAPASATATAPEPEPAPTAAAAPGKRAAAEKPPAASKRSVAGPAGGRRHNVG